MPFFTPSTCAPEISKEIYSLKQVDSISEKDWNNVRKIEAYHSISGQWVAISPKLLKRLKDFGLTEERLNLLLDTWKKSSVLYTEFTLDIFIESIFDRVDPLPISQSQKAKEFWDFCQYFAQKEINELMSQETCFPSKLSTNKPTSLFLRSLSSDTSFSVGILNLYGRLSKLSQVCTRTFSSFSEFCSKIIDVSRVYTTQFLAINAHGDSSEITTYPDPKRAITLSHPLNDCFQFLPKNVTILFQSCSAGEGEAEAFNLANHVANSAPKGAHVIAPTASFSNLILDPKLAPPHGATYFKREGKTVIKVPAYHIDTTNPTLELCPIDGISPLDFCSHYPLLRPTRSDDGVSTYLQFYSYYREAWFDITKSFGFFVDRRFNNQHLEIISRSDLLPMEFIKEAEKYPSSHSPDELISAIFELSDF